MIDEKYWISSKLGSGGFSNVMMVKDVNEQRYAMKVIKNNQGAQQVNKLSELKKEFEVMELLKEHPNILSPIKFEPHGVIEHNFQNYSLSYLLLEFAERLTLMHVFTRAGNFIQPVARFYFCQLLSAVKFMHDSGYAHLDIKMGNILVDENFNLKLSDFGTAEYDSEQTGLTSWRKGTRSYMAPEINSIKSKGPYNMFKADIYSLGVVLYIMLFRIHPSHGLHTLSRNSTDTSGNSFSQTNDDESCCNQDQNMEDDYECALDLVSRMLETDPDKRICMDEICSHPWLTDPHLSISAEEVYSQVYLNVRQREDARIVNLIDKKIAFGTTQDPDSFYASRLT